MNFKYVLILLFFIKIVSSQMIMISHDTIMHKIFKFDHIEDFMKDSLEIICHEYGNNQYNVYYQAKTIVTNRYYNEIKLELLKKDFSLNFITNNTINYSLKYNEINVMSSKSYEKNNDLIIIIKSKKIYFIIGYDKINTLINFSFIDFLKILFIVILIFNILIIIICSFSKKILKISSKSNSIIQDNKSKQIFR